MFVSREAIVARMLNGREWKYVDLNIWTFLKLHMQIDERPRRYLRIYIYIYIIVCHSVFEGVWTLSLTKIHLVDLRLELANQPIAHCAPRSSRDQYDYALG